MGLKIAISGKGGAGKTTLAAALCTAMVNDNREVVALDADPNSNLAHVLSVPRADDIVPVAEMDDLISERTGSKKDTYGQMFKLNPRVDDLPERLLIEHGGVKIITLGGIEKGGSGCACPESVFIKSLVNHLVLRREEDLIIDMEAGIEHLGRASIAGVDTLLVVSDPGRRSIITAKRIYRFAGEIGLKKILAVGNKVNGRDEEQLISTGVEPMPLVGVIPYDRAISAADISGASPLENSNTLVETASNILDAIRTPSALTG